MILKKLAITGILELSWYMHLAVDRVCVVAAYSKGINVLLNYVAQANIYKKTRLCRA